MDCVFELLDLAEKSREEVTQLIDCHKYAEAYVAAMEALNLFIQALTLCKDDDCLSLKVEIRQRVKLHSALCEDLRSTVYSMKSSDTCAGATAKDDFSDSNANVHAKERDYKLVLKGLEKRVVMSPGSAGLDNVVGHHHLKKLLKTSLIMYNNKTWGEELKKRGLKIDRRHFLLFGAPGTGKSMVIRSFHQQAEGVSILELSMTDIMSKYIGDGEAMLNAAFEVAQNHAPCLLFLDEIDGAFGVGEKRGLNVSLINQFLTLSEKCTGVQIFAATNKPWELEPSFRRRFHFLVHLPLPNFDERIQILSRSVKKLGFELPLAHLCYMGKLTMGLSSSDLHKLVMEANEETWRPVQEAQAFRKVHLDGKDMWSPCENSCEDAQSMSFLELNPDQIVYPQFSVVQMEKAFGRVKRTTDVKSGEKGLLGKSIEFAIEHATCARSGVPKKTEEYEQPQQWQVPIHRPYPRPETAIKTPPCMLDNIMVQTDLSIPIRPEPERPSHFPYNVLAYIFMCCTLEYD